MFEGFPREGIDFLARIRANNSVAFYEENRALYERALKVPLRALCEEVAPIAQLIDPELDVRPVAVVSRIRRDTRFTKDKSPLRDHVWLSWRYPGERRSEGFHLFWGFGPDWLAAGCGSYGPDKPLMDALRGQMRRDPAPVLEALSPLELGKRYALFGEDYRRIAVPESIPEALRALYVKKYFGAEARPDPEDWSRLGDRRILARVTEEMERMAPLIQLMKALRAAPVPEDKKPTAQGESAVIRARPAEEYEF